MRFSLILAALALSTVAFAQQDGPFQVGYAANLNIGDSVVNLSNDGWQGGVFPNTFGQGNICVNTYVFDPQEEEIGCCACLVTPNGLNSLSAKADLISNNLTPAVPTSIIIKLVATEPGVDTTKKYTVCNPATIVPAVFMGPAPVPPVPAPIPGVPGTVNNVLVSGMLAWGTTLEPNGPVGTYNVITVPFLQAALSLTEATGLQQLCNFIQANGTGYGICKSCRLGALGGSKQ